MPQSKNMHNPPPQKNNTPSPPPDKQTADNVFFEYETCFVLCLYIRLQENSCYESHVSFQSRVNKIKWGILYGGGDSWNSLHNAVQAVRLWHKNVCRILELLTYTLPHI